MASARSFVGAGAPPQPRLGGLLSGPQRHWPAAGPATTIAVTGQPRSPRGGPAVEARNRTVKDWFDRIRTRQISLPRFQRQEAWGHLEVAGLLTTVLRGLPSGATLILEVGDELPFISRTM